MSIFEKNNILLETIKINNRIIGKIKIYDLIKLDIKIPTIQRLDDKNKTNEIVNYQMKYYHSGKNHLNILGVINIHYCKENDNNYILDGQHRLNSLKILNEYGKISNECVSIEVVYVDNMEELKDNYKLINMNTPLPEFPENIDKNIPEQAFRYFESKWPTLLWSTSNKPNRPNLNKGHIQEAFAYLTSELNINKYNELIELIEEYDDIKKQIFLKILEKKFGKKWIGENNGIVTCFYCIINTFAQIKTGDDGHVLIIVL